MEFLYNIDKAVFLFFNVWLTHPILDASMTRVTHFGFWAVPMTLAAALYVARSRSRKKAIVVLALTALSIGVSDAVSAQILKKIFARPRPCNPEAFVEGGRFLLGMYRSLSFPSTHSMNMFTGAAVLFCFYSKLAQGACFFAFAAMIAYSRVYCGVHYPSDVAAGAVFGTLLGWGIYRGYVKITSKFTPLQIQTDTKKPPPNVSA